jgi:hypothetical protein
MPLYVYEVVLPDGSGGEVFEVLQPMSEAPLTEHPVTGQPVRRVLGVPNAPKAWTDTHAKGKLSDKKLEGMGFSKYVRGESGYQKLYGKGPEVMKKPPQGS